jgi:hypothetical protein
VIASRLRVNVGIGSIVGQGHASEDAVGGVGEAFCPLGIINDHGRGVHRDGRGGTPGINAAVLGHKYKFGRAGKTVLDDVRRRLLEVFGGTGNRELLRLPGKVARGIVRLPRHESVAVVGESRNIQNDQFQAVLMERVAGHIANVFRRVTRACISDPEMAAGARRTQGKSPGIEHFFIDDLRMILRFVGDQIGLYAPAIAGLPPESG